MRRRYDLMVVGAGLFGLTVAEQAANRWNKRVLIKDRREHIGGNAHSYVDASTGIEVHKYGAHIFHTSNRIVWEYVSQFTDFSSYEHRVFTRSAGRVYNLPINLETINSYFRTDLNPRQARAFLSQRRGPQGGRDLESWAIAQLGVELYEAFIKGYTEKQWATKPSNLPASTIARLPIRYNYDSRYFSDLYQGLPIDGYEAWFTRMIANPLIEVRLGCAHAPADISAGLGYPTVYTGAIDGYFDRRFGSLGWRGLRFETETVAVPDYQGTAVMNEADASVPYTRTIEFRHLRPERRLRGDSTVIAREYPQAVAEDAEPYYPVNSPADRALIRKYRELASAADGVYFGGRLGSYKYLDMHMAVASALRLVERIASDYGW